jgi:hypothetical protein
LSTKRSGKPIVFFSTTYANHNIILKSGIILRGDIEMPATNNSNAMVDERACVHPGVDNRRDGLTVECICPKCGTAHRMKLLWSGRGKPKKYCPACKSFVATIESIDFCGIPKDVHRGIEKAV